MSLVPSLTETVVHWGIRPVGATEFCIAPPLPEVTRIGGTKNPDHAGIRALRPDLVLADREENRRIDVDRLRAVGIPVHVTAARSLPEVADTLERLGRVLEVSAVADALARSIRSAIASPPSHRLRAACLIWRDPWMSIGSDTIAGDLLAQAGFDLIPHRPRYPRVTLEELAAARPAAILLPDEPYAFGPEDAQVFASWPTQVRLIDGQMVTWWGIRTPESLRTLRQLAQQLGASG